MNNYYDSNKILDVELLSKLIQLMQGTNSKMYPLLASENLPADFGHKTKKVIDCTKSTFLK